MPCRFLFRNLTRLGITGETDSFPWVQVPSRPCNNGCR